MQSFEFEREWRVRAPMTRVRRVLGDLERYPEWWPQVLAVAKIDDDTARVLCRSRLPYTLDLVLHAERDDLRLLEVRIEGDLTGWSRFVLVPEGSATRIGYTQQVAVARSVLALAGRLARPVLRWNHDQMMADCEVGLGQRLAGLRRGRSDAGHDLA